VISGFRCIVTEILILLGCYAVSFGRLYRSFGITYRTHLSRVFFECLTLQDGTDRFPETSVSMLLINIFTWVCNSYMHHLISKSIFEQTSCLSHKWTNLKFRSLLFVTFMAMFNIPKFYVLPIQCSYVFLMNLRTNSGYFLIHS
jgi:hypothetical protein